MYDWVTLLYIVNQLHFKKKKFLKNNEPVVQVTPRFEDKYQWPRVKVTQLTTENKKGSKLDIFHDECNF